MLSHLKTHRFSDQSFQESKCGGSSVPYNPLDEESDYICLDCGNSFSNKYAEMLLKNAERDLKTPDKRFDLIQHLEMFIHNNSRKFFFPSLFSH